jgi:SpoVK/Ycf46/Vps4 family AAA+-type ATPase
LTGVTGQGKTTIAGVVSNMLKEYTMSLAHVVWVDCRSLLGQSTENIDTTLSNAWKEASNCSPSVLVFDDLDVLIPSDNDGISENATAARFAELMVDLMWEHERKTAKRLAWCRNAASAVAVSGERSDNAVVLDRWSNSNSHGIGVIATGERTGSLHVELRRSNMFDQHVELPKYDQTSRVSVLRALITKRADEAKTLVGNVNNQLISVNTLLQARDDLDFYRLAQKMEGYGPSDMNMVLERVCNRSANRVMEEMYENQKEMELNFLRNKQHMLEEQLMSLCNGSNNISTSSGETKNDRGDELPVFPSQSTTISNISLELTQSDFDVSMKGFVPASLRGIKFTKSSVEWEDVGGLVDVSSFLCRYIFSTRICY